MNECPAVEEAYRNSFIDPYNTDPEDPSFDETPIAQSDIPIEFHHLWAMGSAVAYHHIVECFTCSKALISMEA